MIEDIDDEIKEETRNNLILKKYINYQKKYDKVIHYLYNENKNC